MGPAGVTIKNRTTALLSSLLLTVKEVLIEQSTQDLDLERRFSNLRSWPRGIA